MPADPRPTEIPPAPTPLTVDQLEALVDATREIAAILELDPVLQLIVDRVRGLVGAEYAALGIVGSAGRIERFVTSGMSERERATIGPLPRGLGLLGLISREGRSYRIADIGRHPDAAGFPANHPHMRSFLGVPISIHNRSVGNLYLTNKRDAPEFSEADLLLVEMFSLRAAIAIENARLHEQVQRLAVVEERERISRDLHDGIIQAIYGVALSLEDVTTLMDSDPAEAEARVDHAIDSLNLTIREIRNFILGLRSELLHGADVVAGMATLAEEFAASGAADVDLDLTIDPEVTARFPTTHRVQLLQMTREALSNAARHAYAKRIRLAVRDTGGMLELTVEDDGIGFDTRHDPPAGHLGLANLRQRAAALGGIMTIESSPGPGTRQSIRIPLISEERPE